MPDQDKEKEKSGVWTRPITRLLWRRLGTRPHPLLTKKPLPPHFLRSRWSASIPARSPELGRNRRHGRLRPLHANQFAAGVARVGRLRGADQRPAPFESGRPRYRRVAREKCSNAAHSGADVCTDFFDQVEHRIVPALRSGTVVLADRFIFTLIARSVVRGINRDYLSGLYAMALRPHLTFWLNVRPETAFAREFNKAQAISYWEAGRDMSLSHDLYWSFIRYQTMIKREFEVVAKRHNFIELDGEASVSTVNKLLRHESPSSWAFAPPSTHPPPHSRTSGARLYRMPDPVHIAAIDAGSNAVRLLVVRAYSALDIEPLHNERYPLRLGEGVFLRHRFSEEIFKRA